MLNGLAVSKFGNEKLMELTGNWNYPTAMRFGAGRVNELGVACVTAGSNNPLIVTDPGLAELPINDSIQ